MSLSAPQQPSCYVQDADLLRQVADRRQDSLAELYDRHGASLLALATRVLHDPEDAEDVLQEVFVHIWHQASQYDPARSSVSTWLVLITRSRAIDRLRSRKVVERVVTAAHQENPRDHTSSTGAANVLSNERRERVRRELKSLPAEQQQVLELAFYRGMTQSAIAKATGIPLGTVKTRTLLAMKKLRKAFRAEVRDLL